MLPGIDKVEKRLFSIAVPGYALVSTLLLIASPFLLLETAYLILVLGLHILFGLVLLGGCLYAWPASPTWSRWTLPVAATTYGAAFVTVVVWGDLQVPFYNAWSVLLFSFGLLLVGMDWGPVYRRVVSRISPRVFPWALTGVALALRFPFYLLPPRLSTDFNAYQLLATKMGQGAVPYRDLFVPYTPGFTLLLQVLGLTHMVDALRPLLVIPDLLIVLVLATGPGEGVDRLRRAAAWVLFPLPALEIAWSAHFDGLVALLLLVAGLRLKRAGVLSGLLTGVTATIRPVALAIGPSALMGSRSLRSWVIYAAAACAPILLIAALYVGDLLRLVGFSVTYQLNRASYGSLRAFIAWYTSGGGAERSQPLPAFPIPDLGLGPAPFIIAALIGLNLLVVLRSRSTGSLVRGYGLVVSSLLVLWGAAILAFPASFPGGIPVGPSFPFYRPSPFYFASGALTAALGSLLGREWWRTPPAEGEVSTRLMFLNLFATVFVVSTFYSWYLLWAAPALMFLLPRRTAVLGLVACLALAPTAYYASDFSGLGSTRNGNPIVPTSFSLIVVRGPSPGSTPVGWYEADLDLGMTYLSSLGNITVAAPLSIDPRATPVLGFTIISDRDSLGWNLESVSVWIEGRAEATLNVTDFTILGNWHDMLPTGITYYANVLYAHMAVITGIAVRFENHDAAPHRLWFGQVSFFAEYP